MAEKVENNVAGNDRIESLEATIKELQERVASLAKTAQVAINQNKQLREVIKQMSELL